MKPLLLKVQESASSSFDIRYEKVPYFDNPWHYHPEIELTLVTKSNGIRFIGDSIEPFEAGDLVLLGANLPHYWRNNESYYNNDGQTHAEAIVMRFRQDLWGNELINKPEMQAILALFQRAELGIHYQNGTSDLVMPLLLRTLKTIGPARLIFWLQIFEILADAKDFRLLSQKSFSGLNPREDSSRIDTVLAYVQAHLAEHINLADIASLANMNKTAFCRYFKQQTNKTFVDVLNEIRIQSACRLLIDSGKDIGQIAYECGFQDIPYFNQVFKNKKQINPSAFRNANKVKLRQ